MDASRAQIQATLAQDEKQSIADCSLQSALNDLRQYYAAGTIVRGLTYVQGQMQNQVQAAQDKTQAIKAGGLTISDVTLPAATAGSAYQTPPISVSGGTAPYLWSVTSSTPATATGTASGNAYVVTFTPANATTAESFTLKVTDSSPTPLTGSRTFTVNMH